MYREILYTPNDYSYSPGWCPLDVAVYKTYKSPVLSDCVTQAMTLIKPKISWGTIPLPVRALSAGSVATESRAMLFASVFQLGGKVWSDE